MTNLSFEEITNNDLKNLRSISIKTFKQTFAASNSSENMSLYFRNKMSFEKKFCEYSRTIYSEEFIPLHRPVFKGLEKKYLNECIDTNFVSSVGKKVSDFEDAIVEFTKTKYAIATVSGTAALHIAMELAGVKQDEEVLTQPLTLNSLID